MERLAVTEMIVLVLLIVTLVHHVVSIAIRVRRVVTVMIALAGLIVMLLVERLAVTEMIVLVLLIVTRVHHVVSIAIRVRRVVSIVIRVPLVVIVMIVLAGLIVIRVRLALLRKNVLMKLKVALASAAQVVKCHCHQSVLVKIG